MQRGETSCNVMRAFSTSRRWRSDASRSGIKSGCAATIASSVTVSPAAAAVDTVFHDLANAAVAFGIHGRGCRLVVACFAPCSDLEPLDKFALYR